jgi:hypothetical protein
MPKFTVAVSRKLVVDQFAHVEVDAENEEQALKLASSMDDPAYDQFEDTDSFVEDYRYDIVLLDGQRDSL